MREKKNKIGKTDKHGDFSKFIKQGKKKDAIRTKKHDKKQIQDQIDKKAEAKKTSKTVLTINENTGPIRLNRYIANAGVCSRRDADQLISNGKIKVNNKVVLEMGEKVTLKDTVTYKGKVLRPEKMVYVMLNKPKGYITTTDDPFERKTVMSLVEKACPERILPVGRLDRNTTGLLLFTNDGEVAKRLTHPSYNIKKIYHAVLDKPLTQADMQSIADGVELEDGLVKIDKIAWAEGDGDKKEIGIEIHSGKNRVIRRLFEYFKYDVVRLDRVSFAGFTKKDIPRGKWRMLKDIEISRLKMIGESKSQIKK